MMWQACHQAFAYFCVFQFVVRRISLRWSDSYKFFVIRLEEHEKLIYDSLPQSGSATNLFQATVNRFSRTLADQAKGKHIVF
jgi:hypothetical protein